MENKKNEELQSRRDFFKKAAKGVLPILGAIALAGTPQLLSAANKSPTGCQYGCSYGCSGTCHGSCYTHCQGCTGCTSCSGTCFGGCNSNCSYGCTAYSG